MKCVIDDVENEEWLRPSDARIDGQVIEQDFTLGDQQLTFLPATSKIVTFGNLGRSSSVKGKRKWFTTYSDNVLMVEIDSI
jgi:hypothetical protein